MKTELKLVEVGSMEAAAKEYIELKAQEKKVAERLAALKAAIGPFLNAQADQSALLAGWEFTLTYSERENFKLSEAKKNIEASVLKPFISVTPVSTIRTSYRGEE